MRLKSIGKIVSNKSVEPGCYRMRLRLQPPFRRVTPGQFVHLRLSELSDETLLRRPFSIYNTVKPGRNMGMIEVLYQVVGKGTRFMTTLKPGEKIDVLGPLGNGFKINRQARISILVAGGMGVAGLHLLLKQLMDKKGKHTICLLLGAKTRKELYLLDTYHRLPLSSILIITEDGSSGTKGLVTTLLEKLLRTRTTNYEPRVTTQVYACGPEGMLKEVGRIAQKKAIPCQVSLERQMGCGLGICRACVCKVRDGKTVRYATVCADGPVFEAGQIIYD